VAVFRLANKVGAGKVRLVPQPQLIKTVQALAVVAQELH
jgi:hypothetical protein